MGDRERERERNRESEMVVAQLVERLLPTPEVCGSNLVIGKIYIEHCLLSTVLKSQQKKKKSPGIAHFIKKTEGGEKW